VHDAVAESPGANLSTVVERADANRSTVRYHLRILELEGVVERHELWGTPRVFPAGTDDVEFRAAVQEDSTRSVLEAVKQCEPASGSTIAAEVGRDASTVSHHLDRLAEVGLVDREREGRAVVNRLTPEAREVQALQSATADAFEGPAEADD
jgi:predicted transcriptional regulator